MLFYAIKRRKSPQTWVTEPSQTKKLLQTLASGEDAYVEHPAGFDVFMQQKSAAELREGGKLSARGVCDLLK